MRPPPTHYATSGDASIAYQVLGDGPCTVAVVNGPAFHLDLIWEEPRTARSLRRLASVARLIMFDRRGTGLSDPALVAMTLEQQVDDMLAVLDAAGSERIALIGGSDLGLSAMFAATNPERVEGLVLSGVAADGAHMVNGTAHEALRRSIEGGWGLDPALVELYAPSQLDNPEFVEWWLRMQRSALSPGTAIAVMEMNAHTDLRAILPTIRVPTLVQHISGDRLVPVRYGREVADLIPDARFIEYPGTDAYPWCDPPGLSDIEEFLTGRRTAAPADRVLSTVLFTDIVDSTRHLSQLGDQRWRVQLEEHDRLVRDELRAWRGAEVKNSGDGFLATFDGPARAVNCAAEIIDRVGSLGLSVRAGVHTGECELRGNDVAGIAVHIASRVMSQAGPGEVLTSSTVKELVSGSGLRFADRGEHELRGIDDPWHLYALQRA